jgi:type II secretory pathway component GspD/PulD (secretin)
MLRTWFVVTSLILLLSSPALGADDSIPEWAQPSEKLLKTLKQPMSFVLPNEELGSVTRFMSKLTKVTIEVSPKVEDKLITSRTRTKTFEECMQILANAVNSQVHYGAHFVYIGDDFYYPDISKLSDELQEELKQPCALEFKHARLSAIVSFINRLTQVKFSVNDDLGRKQATLMIRDLPLIECLQILCSKYDLVLRQTDENGLRLESRLHM